MLKFTITIEVDEEALRNIRGEDGAEESITSAIEQEMGWVNQSGIYVIDIKPTE
jgi:hypothetical protein